MNLDLKLILEKIQKFKSKIIRRAEYLTELVSQGIISQSRIARSNIQDEATTLVCEKKVIDQVESLKQLNKSIKNLIRNQEQKVYEKYKKKSQKKKTKDATKLQKIRDTSSEEVPQHFFQEPLQFDQGPQQSQKGMTFFDKFANKYKMIDLKSTTHKSRALPYYQKASGPKQSYRCPDHPDKLLIGIPSLRRHMQVHETPNYLKCYNCDMQFSGCIKLAEHIRDKYYPKGPHFHFVCPFTNKEIFGGIASVSHHISKTQQYFIENGIIVNKSEKPKNSQTLMKLEESINDTEGSQDIK